jgi:hypothetical protein
MMGSAMIEKRMVTFGSKSEGSSREKVLGIERW